MIAGTILVINVMTLWCIDVSVSAMVYNAMMATYQALGNTPLNLSMPFAGMTNGILTVDPVLMYHIALYLNVILNVSMFMIVVHKVIKDDEKKDEK